MGGFEWGPQPIAGAPVNRRRWRAGSDQGQDQIGQDQIGDMDEENLRAKPCISCKRIGDALMKLLQGSWFSIRMEVRRIGSAGVL